MLRQRNARLKLCLLLWPGVSVACCALASLPASAGIRGPGRYCGVVIFDRWDACYLYSNAYVMYVSEKVKDGLRQYSGSAIELDAMRVLQPINPGDGLIEEYKVLGPATAGHREWIHIDGLNLRAEWSFSDGRPQFRLRIANAGHEPVAIFADELALTLLTRKPPRYWGPADGPSYAFLTRFSFELLESPKGLWPEKQWILKALVACPLPASTDLAPGRELVIPVVFNLPPGEYQFLCGYGGGVFTELGLASNLIAFDMDKAGKAHFVAK